MGRAYTSSRDKRRDFWLGFAGWWIVNLLAGAAITGLGFVSRTVAIGLGAALMLLNAVVPIGAAFRRQYLALGIIVAFASVAALVVVEGVFSTVSDFVGVAGGTAIGGTAGGNFVIGTFVLIGVVALIVYGIIAFFVLRRVARRL